jgi:acetyl-CoA carboxylase biotin carboxyl carrier protein
MNLKQSDITALVTLFGDTEWREMHLKYGDEELFLSKDPSAAGAFSITAAPAAAPMAPSPVPASGGTATSPAGNAAGSGAPTPPDNVDRSNWVEITAPNLGTFYRKPSPDADPYVTVGAKVAEDTEVCLIEVMKLFTTLRAGMSGIVREVVAQDGQMVEFGATLMWIEPEA